MIIGVIIWKYNDLVHIDVREIIRASSSELAAAGSVLGVYLLKSFLFVIPASIIYTAVGVAFGTWKALAINAVGILIEVAGTWLLGRLLGGDQVEKLIKRSKKGAKLMKVKDTSRYSAIFGIRVLPVFPIDFVSLFLGASKMKFLPYLLISFGGIFPRVALFTILGSSIYDILPMKYIVVGVILIVCAALIAWVIRYAVKMKKGDPLRFEAVLESGKEIILDTDFGPDCDDVGALAILLRQLGEKGRAPLGVVNCTSNPHSNAAIRAVLDFCGFPEVPVAATSRRHFFEDDSKYTPEIAEKYLGQKDGMEAEAALSFYRRVLKKAENDSVVIVSVGMLNNIGEITSACPDLIKKKVHALVAMAGDFPEGREYNVYCDAPASANVFENFPAPIVCTGHEIGRKIKSGFSDAPENAEKNPIYESYRIYCGKKAMRESWDLTAVDFALNGAGSRYRVSDRVRIEVDENGTNRIRKDPVSERYYLKLKEKPEAVGAHFDSLLRSYDRTGLAPEREQAVTGEPEAKNEVKDEGKKEAKEEERHNG